MYGFQGTRDSRYKFRRFSRWQLAKGPSTRWDVQAEASRLNGPRRNKQKPPPGVADSEKSVDKAAYINQQGPAVISRRFAYCTVLVHSETKSNASKMAGKFQLTVGDDDNMDKILEATGYSAEMRSLSRSLKPIVGFVKEGEGYVLTMSGGGKEVTVNVTLGQEVTHTTLDGRTAKSVFTREAGVGIIQLETIDGKTTKYVRNVVGDEMHVTVSCGDLVAKRVYKRI